MDESERLEYEADARNHGLALMLDRMGMDGLGNEVVALHKRIAGLEAQRDDWRMSFRGEEMRAEQAEADRNACAEAYENETNLRLKAETALAERKGRRCETCLIGGHCVTEATGKEWVEPDEQFYCSRWAARAEEGSE